MKMTKSTDIKKGFVFDYEFQTDSTSDELFQKNESIEKLFVLESDQDGVRIYFNAKAKIIELNLIEVNSRLYNFAKIRIKSKLEIIEVISENTIEE